MDCGSLAKDLVPHPPSTPHSRRESIVGAIFREARDGVLKVKEFRVFFSWQSDLCQKSTTRAIRKAIDEACKKLRRARGVVVKRDESTFDLPGSPYIPFAIAEKIRKADIFIADITPVARLGAKALPNPNVVYELGLAVAHLGWDRVVLLFNEKLERFVGVPFDFSQHRVSKFATDASKGGANDALERLVFGAISTICESEPLRPRQLESRSEAEIRRSRDVANIKWFLKSISTTLLGEHIMNTPGYLSYAAAQMFDGMDQVLEHPSFRLNDKKILGIMVRLRDSLKQTLAHSEHYRDTSNPLIQAFRPNREFSSDQEIRVARQELSMAADELRVALESLVDGVHQNYYEIDIDETDSVFGGAFREFARELNDSSAEGS